MKRENLDVNFESPEQKIKDSFRYSDAKNVSVRRGYGNKIEVSYTIESSDPKHQIEEILEKAGSKNISSSSSYNGARFSFQLDDLIDSREFKRQVTEILRRMGFKSY